MSLFVAPPQKIPAYIPDDVAARLAGNSYSIMLPKNVRARMRTAEKISVADHAKKYRRVTDGPHQGKWRHELAPQSVKIMNTYSKPYVRELWYCGVEQGAKTATMLSCLHWAVDVDPGDIFYLMPTEDASKKIVDTKLIPMIRKSARLKSYISKRQDDIGLKQIKLTNGVTIRPAWANSPSSQASFPAKHVFGDEVDKYPEQAGQEASPEVLIRKRMRLYRGRSKCFLASTPGQRIIYSGTMKCAQVFQYRNRCPHCGNLVKFEGKHLVVPEGLLPSELDAETDIGLVCPHCAVVLSSFERDLSCKTASWVCIKGDAVQRPATVGFHYPAWPCHDIPLYEIAAAWLTKEQDQDRAVGVAWANGYEAIDYVHEQKDREEEFILRLVDKSQPRSIVPNGSWGVVMMADTQQLGFYYQVWAIGWGQDLPVTVIEHGRLDSFAELKDKEKKVYEDASGKKYLPKAGMIDSGGGTNPARPKHTRTREVYDFCRKNKFWRPLKGRRDMEAGWNVKRRDYYPNSVGKKVPIPGGLKLYSINVTFYKNELDHKLQKENTDSGSITLHASTGNNFAKQMCAEYQDERGYWICPKGKDNHHWDIAVYGLALADIMGIRDKRRVKKAAVKRTKKNGGGFATNY